MRLSQKSNTVNGSGLEGGMGYCEWEGDDGAGLRKEGYNRLGGDRKRQKEGKESKQGDHVGC